MASLPAFGYLTLVSQGLREPPKDYETLISELSACSICELPLIRSGKAVVCIECDRP